MMRATRIIVRLLAAGALTAAGAMPAGAQQAAAAFARIEGQVVDSVRSAPANSAIIVAVRVSPEPHTLFTAFGDERGRFHFDSLPAGRYAVSVSNPTLDSLGVVLPDRLVDAVPGATAKADLGLPSAATLRRAACPGVALGKGEGAVVGTVWDAGTERPLAGASIVVGWRELKLDRATMQARSEQHTGAVKSDSLGQYRLCGVPTDENLAVQVQHAGVSGAVVDVMVRDSVGMIRRDLSFSSSGSAIVEDTTAEAAASPDTVRMAVTGTAVVTGRVNDAQGRPMADVELRLADVPALSTRSDAEGRFTLSRLPAGTQVLEARRVGYQMVRTPLELRAGQTTTQSVLLARVVTLDSIRIIAQRTRYPEFERHRHNGWGTFIDEAAILRRSPVRTSDLLRMVNGFRIVNRGFDEVVVSSRGPVSIRSGACVVGVVVDGMQGMDLSMVHPSDIAAIEAYPSGPSVPADIPGRHPCGVIVIWTKR